MGALAALAIQQLPAVLQLLKDWHQQANPGAPMPTDDEVIQAYQAALTSSLARDSAWLSVHGTQDVSGNDITGP